MMTKKRVRDFYCDKRRSHRPNPKICKTTDCLFNKNNQDSNAIYVRACVL